MTQSTNAFFRLLPVVTAACLAISLASCSDYSRVYTVKTEVTPDDEIIHTPQLTTVETLRRAANQPGPKVRVEEATHDFGLMDPLTMGSHTFYLRNVGDQPMEVQQGPTTCKCTLSNLSGHSVEPGGEARVVVQWNSGKDALYAHSATVYTNDPRQRVVTFSIRGKVRTLFRCEPPELVFSRVAPGQPASASAVVYSQAWNDFAVEKVETSISGLDWKLTKLTAEQLSEADIKSAYRLDVTLPDNLEEGYFNGLLHLAGRATDVEHTASPEPTPGVEAADGSRDRRTAECELAVHGKVLRRLAVYGPAITTSGVVDIGRIREGDGAQVKLLLKVRDPDVDLTVRHLSTTPGFLQARVERHESDSDRQLGLYYLYVEVPSDAPPFRLPPDRMAQLTIEFDHPRIDSLKLPVDLIITRKSS